MDVQTFTPKQAKDISYLRCEICQKVFSRSWLLKNHQRIHTGERPYKCTYCEKAFSDKSNLRQHMKIHTTKEKLFKCGICDRTFAQRRYLVKHASEIHRNVNMGVYGATPTVKRKKLNEEVKEVTVGSQVVATELKGETIPRVGSDHQYMTRQKTRHVASTAKRPPVRKYSEQDLKDFIKSNQTTMEKNGYIFIKQNFQSMDTEPALTEISEVELTQEPNATLKSALTSQLVKLGGNGKIVSKKDNSHKDGGTDDNSKEEKNGEKSEQKTNEVHIVFPEKEVTVVKSAANNSGKPNNDGKITLVGTNSQIIKSSVELLKENKGTILSFRGLQQPSLQPIMVPKPVASQQRPAMPQPVTYLQMVQPGMLPMPGNNPVLIPVSMVTPGGKIPANTEPVSCISNSAATVLNSGLKTITLPVADNKNILVQPEKVMVQHPEMNLNLANNLNAQVLAASNSVVNVSKMSSVDEKGAAPPAYTVPLLTSTSPVVSDASWQGVLNISSEQELLHFINSQSAGFPNGGDSEKGLTIFIQNVDPAMAGVSTVMVDNSVLEGVTNLSDSFQDQETVISDVLPVPGDETGISEAHDGAIVGENVSLMHTEPTVVSIKAEDTLNNTMPDFSTSPINENALIISPLVDGVHMKSHGMSPDSENGNLLGVPPDAVVEAVVQQSDLEQPELVVEEDASFEEGEDNCHEDASFEEGEDDCDEEDNNFVEGEGNCHEEDNNFVEGEGTCHEEDVKFEESEDNCHEENTEQSSCQDCHLKLEENPEMPLDEQPEIVIKVEEMPESGQYEDATETAVVEYDEQIDKSAKVLHSDHALYSVQEPEMVIDIKEENVDNEDDGEDVSADEEDKLSINETITGEGDEISEAVEQDMNTA